MKTLRQVLQDNKKNKKAIPAFNIDSFEIYQAVESVVVETGLSCIVQLSAGEDKFIQAERLLILVKKAQIDGLPIYLNMDHGSNPDRLEKLVRFGFDMVHLDNSALEYSENLTKTASFISRIRSINPDIVIEGEFNKINLVEKGISPDSFTNPEQAMEFVSKTDIDLLAVSIGNLHGVSTNLPEKIDLNLLNQIATVLPDKFLTLHGGSGISSDQISAAINSGIVKININTDLRLAFKSNLKKILETNQSEKIYEYLNPVISEVAKIAKEKFLLFSSEI